MAKVMLTAARHSCRRERAQGRRGRRRQAAATLDYILTLGVIFPAVVFALWAVPRILRLTYEMVCSLIAWPFM
ncbi:MAG: hypothetical protein NZ899_03870 [Thermoguttaceae bacterium]|nr:hypothetical protein [Thermoguttaceae bacterium]MDW8077729.1 hypothetical protein [Thermoguttaceae bacterium]